MVHRLSIVVLLLALLTACGSAPAVQPAPEPAAQPTAAPAVPAAATFPVTLEHKFGATTIPAAPQRVIALGYTDQDPILALGVQPVAVRYFFGDPAQAFWPWAAELQEGSTPTILNMPFGELNLEAIAALQPDLIIGVSAGITDAEYALLSQIAPTLAQSAAYVDFGVPWQEQTRVIGAALGRAEQAEALVAATEARFADVQQQYPGFNGASAVIAAPAAEGQFFFSGPQHERQRVLTSLGFALPSELADLAGESFYGSISGERLDLLDQDVLIWTATPDQRPLIEANPLYQQLAAVAEGRVIWLDTSGNGDLVGPALVYSSVLSLPIVFDQLAPQLAAALDGDPATNVAATAVDPCAADQRTIVGAFGPTCIPAAPQRIIALNEGVMANLLALGVTPVAVSDYANRDYTGYLGDTSAIASVGTPDGPNFEAMLALNPDLILGMPSDVDEQTRPLFEQIAPLAISPSDSADWRGNFSFAGEAVGRADQAASILGRTEARLAAFREAYAAQAPDETVAIIRSRADSFNIYNRESFIAELVKEAGLRMPPAFDELEPWNSMSLENITLLTGDKLFVMVRNEREAGAFRELSASPLWQTIPAVRNDAVEVVNWNVWVAGWNIIGANLVIDDLHFYMLGGEPEQPNPLSDLIVPDFGPQNDAARLGM